MQVFLKARVDRLAEGQAKRLAAQDGTCWSASRATRTAKTEENKIATAIRGGMSTREAFERFGVL
jgi:hypothetical protein